MNSDSEAKYQLQLLHSNLIIQALHIGRKMEFCKKYLIAKVSR